MTCANPFWPAVGKARDWTEKKVPPPKISKFVNSQICPTLDFGTLFFLLLTTFPHLPEKDHIVANMAEEVYDGAIGIDLGKSLVYLVLQLQSCRAFCCFAVGDAPR